MASRRQIEAGHAYILIEALDKTEAVFKKVGRKLTVLGDSFITIGRRAAFLAGSMALPFMGAVGAAKSFSDEILYLQSVLGATDEQMTPLIRKIKELTNSSTYLAVDIAKAATELAQGGFSKSQIADSLQAVLDMARGARMELGPTAKVMVDTLTLFNMKATEASSVADKFFIAAKNGTIDVADLAQSFSYAALSANEMGFSLDETLGILSAISLRMLKATKAGTSLNQFFTSLASNADKLREIGVDPFDAAGKAKPGLMILKELSQKMRTMNQEQKISIMEKIFNVRGMRAAMAGAGAALEEIFAGVEEIKKSEGAASKAASKMDEGIGGALRRIGSAANMMLIEIGMALEPTFKMLGEAFRPYFNGVIMFIRQNQEAVKSLAAVIVAISAYAGAFLVVGVAIKLFLPLWTALRRSFQVVAFLVKGVIGSLGLLVKGLTLVEGALMFVVKGLGSLVGGLMSAVGSIIYFAASIIGQGIVALVSFGVTIITTVIPAIVSWGVTLTSILIPIISQAIVAIGAFVAAAASMSLSFLISPIGLVAVAIASFIGVLLMFAHVLETQFGLFPGLVNKFVKEVVALPGQIFGVVKSILGYFWGLLKNVGSVFADLAGIGWAWAKSFFTTINFMQGVFFGFLHTFTLGFTYLIQSLITSIAGLIGDVWSLVGSIFKTFQMQIALAWQKTRSFFSAVIGWGKEFGSLVGTSFAAIPSLAQDAFGSVMTYIKQIGPAFQEIIGGFAPAFQGTFNGLYDIAKTSIGLILEAIKMGDFEGAWNIAVSGFTGIWKVLLGNLKIQWVNFVAEFKSLFFSAIAAITSAWRTAINNLAKGFLESAASNKVMNAFVKSVSGIDVQAEVERGKQLNAQASRQGLPANYDPLAFATQGMDQATNAANQQTTQQLADDLKKIHQQMADDIKSIEEDRNKATKDFNDKAAKDTEAIMWKQIQAAAMGGIMAPSGPNPQRKGPLLTDSGAPPFADTKEIKVTSPPATFIKGTAEAAKQAFENTQVNQQIDEDRKQTKILKDIADNTAAAAFFADRGEGPQSMFIPVN